MNKYLILPFIIFGYLSLYGQMQIKSLNNHTWTLNQSGKKKTYTATVPGTVHTDLMKNGVIADPFYGDNEEKVKWIENETWEYQTTFVITAAELASKIIDLRFEGLDTYADVSLNGKNILSANNMFRTWNIPVKSQLKPGKNQLKIVFRPAKSEGAKMAASLPYKMPEGERVFTRKAQYHYGWDWGPKFVTAGIWQDVTLRFRNEAEITHVSYVQEELTDQLARLSFKCTVDVPNGGDYSISINDKDHNIQLKTGENTISLPYDIQNPKRWWTNGLGSPHLYPFMISLKKSQKLIDTRSMNIGLRTIELVQEKDKVGTSFYIKLNGIPVFMKGANYIPPHSFLPSARENVYKALIKNTVEGNMNMLRVWGGGVYAEDVFYDECDKNGILVWQDFMFACAMYPGDTEFLNNVKQEVIDNVRRLENHACIALWCGNNEIDEAWHNWGWQKQFNYSEKDSTKIWHDYVKLFHELIPNTLQEILPSHKNIYWPSSPSIGWGRKESMTQGDSHYWGVWWGLQPFDVYKEKTGRFMSEYGFQGMPPVSSFQKFIPKTQLELNSSAVKSHQKHPTGYQTIQTYMERDYKTPLKFDDYVYVSQILQAEGMKVAMEAHRRSMPHCMGSLYWQLNDCWPVTSWSSVDYYGMWKAFHYQVKRSFEPILLSFHKEDKQIKLYMVNDLLNASAGTLNIQLIDFNGNTLWSDTRNVNIKANMSEVIYSSAEDVFFKFDSTRTILQADFIASDQTMMSASYLFAKSKNLNLDKPAIKIKHVGRNAIEISADKFVKDLYLISDSIHFSDNFFDLLPGRIKKIKLSQPSSDFTFKSLNVLD
ncbi:MAG: glycoside hydrolase family 2 protein [Saprospiraceae bacterium]|jgi:beta-mannosidase|nr:glycoside hydrolase family 2 protein [Saprospiraceae bacterium]